MTDANRNGTRPTEGTEDEVHTITDDMLVIIPVRNLVLFPGTVVPVAINRDRSLAAAQEAVRNNRKLGFLLQHDPDLQAPTGSDLYQTGTVANIVRYVTGADGTHHLVVQGERRFRVLDWQNGLPYMVARVEFISDPVNVSADTRNSIPRFPSLAVEIFYHVAIGLSMDVAVVQAYGTGMKSAEYLSIHVASL